MPGMAPAGRTTTRAALVRVALARVALVVVLAVAPAAPARAAQGDALPEGTIVEVRVEGNSTIAVEQVRAAILSRPGSPLDQRRIEADMKTLLGKRWFSEVTPYYEKAPNGKGYILTFTVKEMPVLKSVEFRGRSHLKQKELEETSGLKGGGRADAAKTRMAIGQIQRLYAEKGFELAEVRLLEGGNAGDTRVVFEIFEGPKHKVNEIGRAHV